MNDHVLRFPGRSGENRYSRIHQLCSSSWIDPSRPGETSHFPPPQNLILLTYHTRFGLGFKYLTSTSAGPASHPGFLSFGPDPLAPHPLSRSTRLAKFHVKARGRNWDEPGRASARLRRISRKKSWACGK